MALMGYWDADADPSGWYENGAYEPNIDISGSGQYLGTWFYQTNEANGYLTINGSTYYYINGEETTLDEYGSGSWNNKYWISAQETTLDSCGNGTWNSANYIDGSQSDAGYSSCAASYWINGQQTTLDQYGTGSWNGSYYITAQQTTLDTCGNGSWNGPNYIDGVQSDAGWSACASKYFLNGVETTLDENGSGSWNGNDYSSGTVIYIAKTFVGGATTDAGDLLGWQAANGTAADTWPAGGANLVINNSVTADSTGVLSSPKPNTITVTTNGSISAMINVDTENGLVLQGSAFIANCTVYGPVAMSGQSNATTVGFYGETKLRDDAFLDGCQMLSSGTLELRGNSQIKNDTTSGFTVQIYDNAANLNGLDYMYVTVAHGGGINGSNILGFA